MVLATNIYLLVCSCIGLIYGLVVLFNKRPPLYFRLIIFAMGCQVFSRVYYVVSFLCYGGLPDVFNIGFIGFGVFLLFLFFVNYNQMDLLVDDNTKQMIKYRLISLIVPLIEIAVSVFALFMDNVAVTVRLSYIMLSVLAGLAGYYNIKHLLIPDVDGGIIKAIRGFNIMSLVVEVLTIAEIGFNCFGYPVFIKYVEILLGVLYIIMLPSLYKEVQKWTQ